MRLSHSKKIILAFDSFKGSLSAREAVEAARLGVLDALPNANVIGLPMADGGEGTTAVLCHYMDAECHTCIAHDPLLRKIEACYAISADGKTAIMEMAATAGLELLTKSERNPMLTTTFGVGEMLLDAAQHGCRHILIGIGGSATNDGGIGMLAALGVRFLDKQGTELSPTGSNLGRIASIDWNGADRLNGIEIKVICDVSNPLFGPNGAAYVYAPQKGASVEDVRILDNGLRNFASFCIIDPNEAGCGAAGGLGFGLKLIGAKLHKGVDIVIEAAHFDQLVTNADLVLTGEGKIDRQTLSGKLPFGILHHAHAFGVPTIALAGLVEDEEVLLANGFHDIRSINDNQPFDLEQAMNPSFAAKNLKCAVTEVVKEMSEKHECSNHA